MNNRKYHTDPEELLRQGKEIMSSSDDSKFYFRVFSVNMVLSGLPVSQISKFAGVSRMTVSSWVKIADEKGFDALKLKGHKGRPPKLTGGQLKEIRQTLESEPQKYGYHVWDGPSLSDYISSKYNITLSVRQCQRLFHSLGFSLIRPNYIHPRDTKIRMHELPLKKNQRSKSRQYRNSDISRRSAFPNSDYNYTWMV